MFQAEAGNLEILRILIQGGATLDSFEHTTSYTALMYAVKNNHRDCVSELIKQGANLDINGSISKNEDGDLWNPEPSTALMVQAGDGNLDMVNLLLRYKPSIDEQNYFNNYTALWYASINGHAECVRLLVN